MAKTLENHIFKLSFYAYVSALCLPVTLKMFFGLLGSCSM